MSFLAYNPKYNFIFTILFALFLGYAISARFGPQYWVTVYFIYFLSFALGVGITLHRVISHSSALIPRPILYFFALIGSVTQTGSPVKWLLGHNLHHKYADTDKDPILPTLKGLNHMLGQFTDVDEHEYTKILLSQAHSPVFNDRFLKSLNDYIYLYTIAIYLLMFVCFGIKGLSAFIIGNIGALVATSVITYLAHVKTLGARTHQMPNNSVNIYGTFLIFFGEEIHNNHHAHPKTISNSESFFQIDIVGLILNLIKKTESRRSYV